MDFWQPGIWDVSRGNSPSEPQDFAHAIAGATEGLWEWDLESGRVHYSLPWFRLVGLESRDRTETLDLWLDRVHEADIPTVRAALESHLIGESARFHKEFRLLHADGDYRWMVASGRAVRTRAGRPARMAGSLQDVSERRLYDPLTGLPNQLHLLDRIAGAIARSRRTPDQRFAILVADLDRFKQVRLSLGHARTDEVLIGVAERLRKAASARAAGGQLGDVVGRLGVDEFAILLNDVGGVRDALQLAEAVRHALKAPFEVGGEQVFTTASVGIVLSAERHLGGADPLREAVTAAERAKRDGSSRCAVYDVGMHDEALGRLRFESDLRMAVAHGDIEVHYQPIVRLSSQRIVGFEALARWSRPGHGDVPPAEFIPVAEDADLIHAIGRSVIDRACRDMQAWLAQPGCDQGLTLSVNLSARQLLEPGLAEQIGACLRGSGLPANLLKLEITESVVMASAPKAQQTLQALKALGVTIAIDDFGTGYSSLSYLHRLPIDEVKIDRSFVLTLCDNHESRAIVDTIITLAAKLGFAVVAEGVETTAQKDHLEHLGCEVGQGFLWDRALPANAIVELLGRG